VLNHAYILYYFFKKSRDFLQVNTFLTNTRRFVKRRQTMVLLEWYNRLISGVLVPLGLALSGGYFTVRLRSLLLHPVRMWRRMMTPAEKGTVSSPRALSMALAGVLGVGNLVGVAAAVSYGGAGAVLWMWISAGVAMMLKYAEIVLALRHRRPEGGVLRGSAMYYIEDSCRRPHRGRTLGVLFAALCLLDAFCMGGMIQVNAVSVSFSGSSYRQSEKL
jgi:AGCS family alanine or glycine:cation symporter